MELKLIGKSIEESTTATDFAEALLQINSFALEQFPDQIRFELSGFCRSTIIKLDVKIK